MNVVHRPDPRRRSAAGPMLTGLAIVAAAVVILVLALNLINGDDEVGTDATPTPSATGASADPSASASAEASESASAEASASASAAAPEEGAFGPTHSMSPDEAFDNAQTCENPGAISNAEQTDITYRISFPNGWFTNTGNDAWAACSLFAPEQFDVSDDGTVPEQVAVTVDVPPGGDFGPGGEFTSEEYTVDGVAAVRYEIEPTDGGAVSEPTVVWIIAIRGSLPAEGNDQPYLAVSTSSDDPDQFAEWVDVLDRMIATLDIGE